MTRPDPRETPAAIYGIPMMRSPHLPKGKALLLDLHAIEETITLKSILSEEPQPFDRDLRFELRSQITLGHPQGRLESDPFDHPPRTSDLRLRLRWVLRVIGYDWRRLRGRLRRIDSRFGVITGLTS